MTSLGADCFVGKLTYLELNPPVSGGTTPTLQQVCEVSNTTETGIDLSSAVDDYPDDKTILYNIELQTGDGNRQTGAGQDEFNNAITGFPTGSPCYWANGMLMNALPCIIGRTSGQTIAPNTQGNQMNFGSKSSFQDRVFYDPLQLRYNPVANNSFTAVRFGDNCVGWNGNNLNVKIMVYLHVHIEGSWGGSNTNNELKIFIRHFDSSGTFRRDYQLLDISGKNKTDVVESADRLIMGFSPINGEDINGNDYFEIWMNNVATSPDDFTVSLFKSVIQVSPVP